MRRDLRVADPKLPGINLADSELAPPASPFANSAFSDEGTAGCGRWRNSTPTRNARSPPRASCPPPAEPVADSGVLEDAPAEAPEDLEDAEEDAPREAPGGVAGGRGLAMAHPCCVLEAGTRGVAAGAATGPERSRCGARAMTTVEMACLKMSCSWLLVSITTEYLSKERMRPDNLTPLSR